MSRTYRKYPVWVREVPEEIANAKWGDPNRHLKYSYAGYYNYDVKSRDDASKNWWSVPSDYKRDARKERRSKVRNHMDRAKYNPDLYDTIPEFRRCDRWNYW